MEQHRQNSITSEVLKFYVLRQEDYRLKKGQIAEGIIERVDFPNKGIVRTEEGKVIVKNGCGRPTDGGAGKITF